MPTALNALFSSSARERRLVEARQRYGVEQQAVVRQVLAQPLADLADELAALFVQLVHRLAGRDRLQSRR